MSTARYDFQPKKLKIKDGKQVTEKDDLPLFLLGKYKAKEKYDITSLFLLKIQQTIVGENVDKHKLLYIVGGIYGAVITEKITEISPETLKIENHINQRYLS